MEITFIRASTLHFNHSVSIFTVEGGKKSFFSLQKPTLVSINVVSAIFFEQ